MDRPNNRTIFAQEFVAVSLLVGVGPTPLAQSAQQSSITSMYETFSVCVPSTAVNSVWIGGANITPANFNGQEVVIGSTAIFRIKNERQRYEVQGPLVDGFCVTPILIPFKAWDVSTIYLAASAPTTVGVILYKGSLY